MANGDNTRETVQTKTCTRCGEERPATLEFFGPRRSRLSAWCRKCHNKVKSAYKKSAKGRARDKIARSKPERHARDRARAKRRWLAIKDRETAKRKMPAAVVKLRAWQAAHYLKNREALKRKVRERMKDPTAREKDKRRREKNKAKIRAYWRRRWRNEAWVALGSMTRVALWKALFKPSPRKARGWETRCGYTIEELRSHLGAQFSDGMSWDNYGTVWEIDHIEPLAKFKIASVLAAEFKIAWGLENLRPLLKHLNRAKGARPAEMFAPPSTA